jgi:hypothetical protein
MDSADFSEQVVVNASSNPEFRVTNVANQLLVADRVEGTVALMGLRHGEMDDVNDSTDQVDGPMPWSFWPWRVYSNLAAGATTLYAHGGACNCAGTEDPAYDWMSPAIPYYIKIDYEILSVTAMEAQYPCGYTVARGQFGTSDAAHSADARIYLYASGTLSSAVDADDTTLALGSGHVGRFPLNFLPNCFYVKVDSEVMLVTSSNTSSDSFTVLRGQAGTTAASHSQNATVELRHLSEQFYRNKVRGYKNPAGAFKITDVNGDAVFSVDMLGEMRYKGMVLPLNALP